MRIFLSGFPVAGIGLAMILLWRFALTKEESYAIRQRLEERRGKV
jgi:Na+/melibiose symporter-like transporter